jgi:hypothetical protein
LADQDRPASSARIAELNDELRTTGKGGTILVTAGVQGRGGSFLAEALTAMRTFTTFTPENDPYGEHDFGAFTVEGTRLFWKIDYYDQSLSGASPDPADPAVTHRVLTILLAEEY